MEWYQALLTLAIALPTALITALITTWLTHRLTVGRDRKADEEGRRIKKLEKARDAVIVVLKWWDYYLTVVGSSDEPLRLPPLVEVRAHLGEFHFGKEEEDWGLLLAYAELDLGIAYRTVEVNEGYILERGWETAQRRDWGLILDAINFQLNGTDLPPVEKMYPDFRNAKRIADSYHDIMGSR